MGYQIYLITENWDWARMYELPGYTYQIYLSAVQECQLEALVYDLVRFCHDHSCSPSTIAANDKAAAFQITGILNALVAVYYQKEQTGTIGDNRGLFFDMFQEVGKNIGKFLKISIDY